MNRIAVLCTTRTARGVIFFGVTFLGACGFALGAHRPVQAAVSFAAGMVLAFAAFAFGTFNIRMADRFVPQMTLAVALFSYILTALVLALVLAATSPRSVHAAAIASGLMIGVALWIALTMMQAMISTHSASSDV